MTPKQKAKKIHQIFEDLYPETPIPLDHKDPYTLLIAVLLSAQCQDVRVNQVTPALFERADNPHDMIKLSVKEIEDIIRPCGLAPRKSSAIWGLSQQLIDSFDAQVPEHFEGLEGLPGVGHKTASVVMAQAFGMPAFPVDTHIHRLATRWGLTSGKNVVKTEEDLKKLFPKKSWNKVHLQFIFFGREHCPARRHDPQQCPICSWAAVESQSADTQEAKVTPKKSSITRAPKTTKAPKPSSAAKEDNSCQDRARRENRKNQR